MNKVSLEGRLTKDPELQLRGERPVCDMRLAVSAPGDNPTCFIDVAAFDDLATEAAELGKGNGIRVEGTLRYEQWQTKTEPPQPRSRHSVLAREVIVTA